MLLFLLLLAISSSGALSSPHPIPSYQSFQKDLQTNSWNQTKIFHSHWQNELGSVMSLVPAKIGANYITWSGWYQTVVGDADGKYDLTGRSIVNNGVQLVTWNVVWSNSKRTSSSLSSWNGYLDPNEKEPKIYANWILTSVSGAFWNSTLAGQDIFTQI